jgi:hypothetical protein
MRQAIDIADARARNLGLAQGNRIAAPPLVANP